MFKDKYKKLTDMARVFLEPKNATHRQYEALRAFFVDEVPGKEAADFDKTDISIPWLDNKKLRIVLG